MKIKLVKDWKRWHKWYSQRFNIVGVITSAFLTTATLLPANVKELIPFMTPLLLVCFVGAFIGRILDQTEVEEDDAVQE